MSETVIKVENLGKKYVLSHQQEGQNYKALRDVIVDGAKSFGNKFLKPKGLKIDDPTHEEFWALKDVSFEIKQGDRVGIIGRNGAGKSTLLKILSRITEPTQGSIKIKGRIASLLEVGTGFHPELTGRENIFLNGAILGMGKAEIKRKFDEIVNFAEVEKFLDTPVKRYSSGMYVRLAFAVAAHLEPEILIVDEVLAVGDAQFQKKCLGKMQEVGKVGRTVLFVSHNMSAIKALCTQCLLMHRGELINNDVSSKVIEDYIMRGLDNKSSYRRSPNYDVKYPIYLEKARIVFESKISDNCSPDIYIEINYNVAINKVGAVIAIKLLDSMDNTISTMIDTDYDLSRFIKYEGKYSVRCPIPGGLLCPGIYFVTLSISDMKSVRYEYLERFLSFTIDANPSTQNIFSGREGSLLFVKSWETQNLLERKA